MRNLNSGTILFNLAGGAVLLAIAGYAGYGLFHTDEVQRCTLRYPAGLRYSLQNGPEQALTPLELQARSGLRARGIIENASIERSPDNPHGFSLDISLASAEREGETKSGVGFVWQPARLAKATSACLSYSVYFPDGFSFDPPGYLPGLFGTSVSGAIDADNLGNGFSAKLGWRAGGDAGVEARTASGEPVWLGPENSPWPTGRWVPVEEEISLANAGSGQTTLRLWVDGRLTAENDAVPVDRNHASGISGVVANVGYSNPIASLAKLKLSPFVIQWQ